MLVIDRFHFHSDHSAHVLLVLYVDGSGGRGENSP